MVFIPQQNWAAYRSLVESQQNEKSRSRAAMQTQKRYAEIFNHVQQAKGINHPIRSATQLQEKLMLRAKLSSLGGLS